MVFERHQALASGEIARKREEDYGGEGAWGKEDLVGLLGVSCLWILNFLIIQVPEMPDFTTSRHHINP